MAALHEASPVTGPVAHHLDGRHYGARQKLDQLDQIATHARATDLGMPAFPQIAGRATNLKSKIDN